MEVLSIESPKPFVQYWEQFVNIIELYHGSGQTLVVDACELYITNLNHIIHESLLYTYTEIISKYLGILSPTSDLYLLRNAAYDMTINNMINDPDKQYDVDSMLSDENMMRDFKKAFLESRSNVSFSKTITNNSVYRFYDAFLHWDNLTVQNYFINSSEAAYYEPMISPIQVMINGQCIASLCVDATCMNNNGECSVYIYNGLCIKCINHVNDIYTITCIDKFKAYSLDKDVIESIEYTVRTYHQDILMKEQQIKIIYPKMK